MKPALRLAAPFLLLALAAGGARAQGEDASVLPRGRVELGVVGTYTRWDSRFVSGGTEPLGAFASGGAFPAARFRPVTDAAKAAIDSIFSVFRSRDAAGYAITEEELGFGTLETDLSADFRTVPVSVRAGVLPRLTIGVTVPIERRGTSSLGRRLVGGGLGVNTAGDSLARMLAVVDSALVPLAGERYLPLADSPAGRALQEQYAALSGRTDVLPLPRRTLNETELNALLTAPDSLALGSSGVTYGLGDVEINARYQFFNTVPARLQPLRGTTGMRAAAEVGLRLPTGTGALADSTLQLVTESGHLGATAAVFGDVFFRRFWVSAHARYDMRLEREVTRRFFNPLRPESLITDSVRVSRDPGDRLELGITPRFRLTDEISFAGRYAVFREGEVRYGAVEPPVEGAVFSSIESTESRTAQLLGLGMSYSTYAAWDAGRSSIPVEVTLLYENAVAGSGRAPSLARITAGLRFFFSGWGRPRRAETPVDAPAGVTPSDTTGAPVPTSPTPTPVPPEPAPIPPTPSPTPPTPTPAPTMRR